MKEPRQEIEDAIRIYYKELGFRRDNSRLSHQTQARMALSNVMREHGMKYEEIKAYVKRDHSTIIYHCKHHESEMKTWMGYRKTYETCLAIVGAALTGDLSETIEFLQAKQDKIQKQIDQYLKKKEENDSRIKELAEDSAEIG
tara:strand:- start:16 stop:444 length:429 start_codon:yes stop_codon:yes gene_type:complete